MRGAYTADGRLLFQREDGHWYPWKWQWQGREVVKMAWEKRASFWLYLDGPDGRETWQFQLASQVVLGVERWQLDFCYMDELNGLRVIPSVSLAALPAFEQDTAGWDVFVKMKANYTALLQPATLIANFRASDCDLYLKVMNPTGTAVIFERKIDDLPFKPDFKTFIKPLEQPL